MKPAIKTALITTLSAIVALSLGAEAPLGKMVWPAKPLPTPPSEGQLVGFIGFSFFAAIVFGLGVSFLAQGYGFVRRVTITRRDALTAYVAIGWLLVSWIPHDNLHMAVGEHPGGLLALLWAFHATLMLAALALAVVLIRTARAVGIQEAAPATRTSSAAAPRRAFTQPR